MDKPSRNNKYLYVFLLIVLFVIPLPFLPKVEKNNSPNVFIPPEDKVLQYEKKIREVLPGNEWIVGLFEGEDILSKEVLRAVGQASEDIAAHELIDKVTSVTTYEYIHGKDGEIIIEDLVPVDQLDEMGFEEIRERLLSSEDALGVLYSKDLSAMAIVARTLSLTKTAQKIEVTELYKETMAKYGLDKKMTGLAGPVVQEVSEFHIIEQVNSTLLPLTILIGLFLIWWLYRRWIAIVVAVASLAIVINFAMLQFYIFDLPYSTISGLVPPMLSALTIALLIHMYNAIAYASQRGMQGAERVRHALDHVRKPALFTSLTTMAGLLSLLLSPIPPIEIFGVTSAFGVGLAFVLVIGVMPKILIGFDNKPWPETKWSLKWMDAVLYKIARINLRYPVQVVGVMLGLLALGAPFIWKVEVETNFLEFFEDGHPISRSTDKIQEKLAGLTALEVIFTHDSASEPFKDPQLLKKLKSFSVWAETQPEVDKVTTMADVVEDINWAFQQQGEGARVIPDDAQLVTQYFFIYDGDDLYDLTTRDFSKTQALMRLNVHGANEIGAVVKRLNKYLKEEFAESGVETQIVGLGRKFSDQEDLLISGQVKSLFGAILLIFILLSFMFRSFKDASLCMVPNVVPAFVMFMTMGALGIWLDFATAVISSHVLGIAVDDTIHLFYHLKEKLNSKSSLPFAIYRSFKQAGRAVTATTFILCVQFGLLVLSPYIPMARFGMLSSLALFAALVFDLFLLPSAMILLYRNKRKGREVGVSQQAA